MDESPDGVWAGYQLFNSAPCLSTVIVYITPLRPLKLIHWCCNYGFALRQHYLQNIGTRCCIKHVIRHICDYDSWLYFPKLVVSSNYVNKEFSPTTPRLVIVNTSTFRRRYVTLWTNVTSSRSTSTWNFPRQLLTYNSSSVCTVSLFMECCTLNLTFGKCSTGLYAIPEKRVFWGPTTRY